MEKNKDFRFKPGDKVLCIKPHLSLRKNNIYTIESYNALGYVLLKESQGLGYFPDRFILVTKAALILFGANNENKKT